MLNVLRRSRMLAILLLAASPAAGGTILPALHPCPVDMVIGDSLRVAWSSTGTQAHRAEEAEKHAEGHDAPMGLLRVGQKEILERTAALARLLRGH